MSSKMRLVATREKSLESAASPVAAVVGKRGRRIVGEEVSEVGFSARAKEAKNCEEMT